MAETERRRELTSILENLVAELDVPPSKYEDAKQRYDAVGAWLNEEGSDLALYDPKIYPQGSFALGTAIRPLGDEDYDVDAVCRLRIGQGQVTQKVLKQIVGDRLKAHGTYARMLDPKEGGRRCWTLRYADASRFHVDILPSIPDDYRWLIALGVPKEQAQHALCITDKETWDSRTGWPKSNPQGYVEWFKSRMRLILEERRRVVAMEKRADVQQVPDYEVLTPLQRVIQLLKRHRDVRYNGDDDKPISVIITTLAAWAYNNEADLIDSMLNVVPGMRRAIENRNGVWWVPNPVNPKENFADKWAETPRKKEIFFEWLDAIEQEHRALLTEHGFLKLGEYLAESYGERDASAAMTKYASRTGHALGVNVPTSGSGVLGPAEKGTLSRFNAPHREPPKWPMALRYDVKISGRASKKGLKPFYFSSDSWPLGKHLSLCFEASTRVPAPFEVYWQVVNTGSEAAGVKGGLRGNIVRGDLLQNETTLYRGMHWIECFIVKDGQCLARSREFVVNIA